MTQTYRQVSDLRRDLVAAAVKVIAHDGVARASTRRIAEEADVSGASLHYAFATKDDLFQAVYESLTVAAFTKVGSAVTPGIGLQEGVRRLLDALAGWLTRDPDDGMTLLELTIWSLRTPTSRHLAVRVYRRHLDLMAGLLREAAGPEAPDSHIDELVRLMMMSLDGAYLQWRALGDDSMAELIPLATELLLRRAGDLDRVP